MADDEYPLHGGQVDGMLGIAARMMLPPPGKGHLVRDVLESIIRDAFRAGWSMNRSIGDLQEEPPELRVDMSSGFPTVMVKR